MHAAIWITEVKGCLMSTAATYPGLINNTKPGAAAASAGVSGGLVRARVLRAAALLCITGTRGRADAQLRIEVSEALHSSPAAGIEHQFQLSS